MKLGAQLYTLRDFVKTADGFRETLERVAAMGYQGVQISAVEAFENHVSPEDTRKWLDELGLTCCATHRPWDRVREQTALEVEIHHKIGCKHIGVGMAPKYCYEGDDSGWRQWIGELPTVLDQFEPSGMHFCFHNHAIEWQLQGGHRGWDLLVDEADSRLQFILDTYWVVHAGADCVAEIERLRGRLGVVHLKDKAVLGWETRYTPVGRGTLNWDRILPAFEEAGTEWLVVEQDDCFGEDPFDCLKESLQFLKACGLGS